MFFFLHCLALLTWAPGTLALVGAHGHRHACAPPAAAVADHTVARVRHSRRWGRSADSCSTAGRCTCHAAAPGERPQALRWPR